MRWLFGIIAWLTFPFVLRKASKLGKLTLQHTELPDGLGWHCSLRAHPHEDRPRYAWTATAMTLTGAIAATIAESKDYPIGGRPEMKHAPRIGGKEFSE